MPAGTHVDTASMAGVGKPEEKEPAGCGAVTVRLALWRLRLGPDRGFDLHGSGVALGGQQISQSCDQRQCLFAPSHSTMAHVYDARQ